MLKKNQTQTHGLFGEVFIGKIWGECFRMWGFLLIDWWCSNRVVLQGSCAQPEVTILHLGGGPSSAEELKDIVVHIF